MSTKPRTETITSDLTVVGGGMAGICAAVAAARQGLAVALVQDRPVLGGNSSSEVRVWVNGATGGKHNRYSREGGIMEEILLENKYRNPDGNAHYWDALLLDIVRAEAPRLQLYLNTPITDVEATERRVTAVSGHQLMSERHLRFESPLFVDASGDGIVAARAGAAHRIGREGRAEYGESWAPEEADRRTLGSSVMFYSKDLGHPVPFRAPAFARDFKENPPTVLAKRLDPKDTRCCYWWIEWGGELDTIRDNEQIRDELLAITYGAWDYLKNSGRFAGVENLEMEWIASIPGKRESRRFVGDYVLTEGDVVAQRDFPDTVAHGGWSIDLHPPKGFYEATGEASRHWHIAGPYQIPYRILYCRDLDNLFLGGRIVSASHVAFGTLRVQMTLAAMGQAAGTAAGLCRRYGTTPRGVYEQHVPELQQTLLRDDQWVIGVPNQDATDLARTARVRASSVRPYRTADGLTSHPLDRDLGIHLFAPARLETGRFLLAVDEACSVRVEIWSEARPENYIPHARLREITLAVPAGTEWVDVPIAAGGDPGQGVFVLFKATPGVRLLGRDEALTGIIGCLKAGTDADPSWRALKWSPCFTLAPEPDAYAADNVINGYSRPYGGPNVWMSEPLGGEPAWIELDFPSPQTIAQVQLAFNSNLTPWYNHLRPAGHEAVPELVRDYRVLLRQGDAYHEVVCVEGNHQRLRRHTFAPTQADGLKVEVRATNGAPCAEIFEIRAYGSAPN